MDRIWHKMYGTEIPTEIEEGRYGSVLQLFDEAVEQYADLTAFVGLGGALTYRDVDRLSKQFEAYLQAELGRWLDARQGRLYMVRSSSSCGTNLPVGSNRKQCGDNVIRIHE